MNPSYYRNEFRILFPAILVFCSGLMLGILLSQAKPLWNDELYTQTHILEKKSFTDILTGNIEEGNNHPLFYLLQKGFLGLWNYRFPQVWRGEWNVMDIKSQILLRLLPNACMALAAALVFYFFVRNFSWIAGVYGLILCLTSDMMVVYWAEARPYALWMLLTTLQSLVLLDWLGKNAAPGGVPWKPLGIIHALLALTVSLSMLQVAAAGCLLWIRGERKLSRHLIISICPAVLALYYYFHSPRFPMWFSGPRLAPLWENLPWDRMVIIVLYALVLLVSFGLKPFSLTIKGPSCARPLARDPWPQWPLHGQVLHVAQSHATGMPVASDAVKDLQGKSYFLFFMISAFLTFMALGWLILKDQGGPKGFTVTGRYFLNLTPLQIIASTVFPIKLWHIFQKQKWLQWNLIILIIGLLIIRMIRLYVHIFG